jgi:hypothetical protein
MELPKGPNFVCIGAQKAGTTWLWESLRQHRSVWLPPIKELHWFDVRYPPRDLGGRHTFRHRTGIRRFTPLINRAAWNDLPWLISFYRSLGSDRTYCDLFKRSDSCIKGEFTPAYAILDSDVVETIHTEVPDDCKILFVMREPVDRLWSGLRMYCRKRRLDINSLSVDQLDALAMRPDHALRSDYARTLKNWSVFGDRLGVFFFEDMLRDPAQFLRSVLTFLNLDSNWQPDSINNVSNFGGTNSPPPSVLLKCWRDRYSATAEAVRRHAGRLPPTWTSL